MARQELVTPMTVGMKLRWARQNQSPPLQQQEVAAIVSLSSKTYQAVERDKSMAKARAIVPVLANKYRIPEEWFWDKKGINPYPKSAVNPDNEIGESVDVVLHVPYLSGKVSISMNQIKTLKLPAGLARNKTFGLQVVDEDNLPRLKPGMIVFCEPRDSYNDGDLVAIDHPTQRVKGPDGRSHPVTVLRRYVHEGGAMRLKPQNPNAESFLAQGIPILGAAKIIRKVYAEDWYVDEVNPTQMPLNPPE